MQNIIQFENVIDYVSRLIFIEVKCNERKMYFYSTSYITERFKAYLH